MKINITPTDADWSENIAAIATEPHSDTTHVNVGAKQGYYERVEALYYPVDEKGNTDFDWYALVEAGKTDLLYLPATDIEYIEVDC